MKFTTAWSQVASQNIVLRGVLTLLSILVLVFSIQTCRLSVKEPLVVERGCTTKEATKTSNDRTSDEIQNFIRQNLSQRFDSKTDQQPAFFDSSEILAKEKEQSALAQRKIQQQVIIQSVEYKEKNWFVEADRIVSLEKIKSVLPLKLKVSVEKVSRSESNPWGLFITKIEQVEEKKEGL